MRFRVKRILRRRKEVRRERWGKTVRRDPGKNKKARRGE